MLRLCVLCDSLPVVMCGLCLFLVVLGCVYIYISIWIYQLIVTHVGLLLVVFACMCSAPCVLL